MSNAVSSYLPNEPITRKLLYDLLEEERISWIPFHPLTRIPGEGWEACLMKMGLPVKFYDMVIHSDDTHESFKERTRRELQLLINPKSEQFVSRTTKKEKSHEAKFKLKRNPN